MSRDIIDADAAHILDTGKKIMAQLPDYFGNQYQAVESYYNDFLVPTYGRERLEFGEYGVSTFLVHDPETISAFVEFTNNTQPPHEAQ